MNLRFEHEHYASDRIRASVERVLRSTKLWSMATVDEEKTPHANAAFFCYSTGLELFFLSDPNTKHCRNIARGTLAAVTIFDTGQRWGGPLLGLQCLGSCEIEEGEASARADALYRERFPEYVEWIEGLAPNERESRVSRFYVFRPAWIKILDEGEFGEEVYVSVDVVPGR